LVLEEGAAINDAVAQRLEVTQPADIAAGTPGNAVTDQSGNPLSGIRVSAEPHETVIDTEGKYGH
jgi:hypothetical protein